MDEQTRANTIRKQREKAYERQSDISLLQNELTKLQEERKKEIDKRESLRKYQQLCNESSLNQKYQYLNNEKQNEELERRKFNENYERELKQDQDATRERIDKKMNIANTLKAVYAQQENEKKAWLTIDDSKVAPKAMDNAFLAYNKYNEPIINKVNKENNTRDTYDNGVYENGGNYFIPNESGNYVKADYNPPMERQYSLVNNQEYNPQPMQNPYTRTANPSLQYPPQSNPLNPNLPISRTPCLSSMANQYSNYQPSYEQPSEPRAPPQYLHNTPKQRCYKNSESEISGNTYNGRQIGRASCRERVYVLV